jgi:predicted nucleotidyltransferase
MNAHVRWRLDFAQTLSATLQQIPGIDMIAVLGSVARGYSDQYSDLELMLVWNQVPSPEQQASLVRLLQAEHRHPAFDPGYHSAFRIQGIPVDLWHTTRAQEEAFIHAVLDNASLDLVANNRVETLLSCIPLFGTDQAAAWKTRIHAYPRDLALRFIQTYLPHFHLRQLTFAARRDNPTAYYHTLSDVQCSLFLVLLALNATYFPTFKWMYPAMRQMRYTPPQIAARLHAMFSEPPILAVDHLRAVLAEALDLVAATYPQIDTTHARYGIDQEARAYRHPGVY